MKQEHVYKTSVMTPHEQEFQCSQICNMGAQSSMLLFPRFRCPYSRIWHASIAQDDPLNRGAGPLGVVAVNRFVYS